VGETHVTADINRFRSDQNRDGRVNEKDRVLEQLHGYDDWSNLRFTFRGTKNYAEGEHDCPGGEPDCAPDEHTSTDHAKFYSGLDADVLEINNEHHIATDHGEVDDFQDEGLSIHTMYDVDWFTWEPVNTGLFEISLTARQDGDVDIRFEVFESAEPDLDPTSVAPFVPAEPGEPAMYEVVAGRQYFVKVSSPDQETGYYDLTVDGPEIWDGQPQGEGSTSVWDDPDHWIIDGARGGQLPTPLDHVTFPVTTPDR
jgi:hypothetical protein